MLCCRLWSQIWGRCRRGKKWSLGVIMTCRAVDWSQIWGRCRRGKKWSLGVMTCAVDCGHRSGVDVGEARRAVGCIHSGPWLWLCADTTGNELGSPAGGAVQGDQEEWVITFSSRCLVALCWHVSPHQTTEMQVGLVRLLCYLCFSSPWYLRATWDRAEYWWSGSWCFEQSYPPFTQVFALCFEQTVSLLHLASSTDCVPISYCNRTYFIPSG